MAVISTVAACSFSHAQGKRTFGSWIVSAEDATATIKSNDPAPLSLSIKCAGDTDLAFTLDGETALSSIGVLGYDGVLTTLPAAGGVITGHAASLLQKEFLAAEHHAAKANDPNVRFLLGERRRQVSVPGNGFSEMRLFVLGSCRR